MLEAVGVEEAAEKQMDQRGMAEKNAPCSEPQRQGVGRLCYRPEDNLRPLRLQWCKIHYY